MYSVESVLALQGVRGRGRVLGVPIKKLLFDTKIANVSHRLKVLGEIQFLYQITPAENPNSATTDIYSSFPRDPFYGSGSGLNLDLETLSCDFLLSLMFFRSFYFSLQSNVFRFSLQSNAVYFSLQSNAFYFSLQSTFS